MSEAACIERRASLYRWRPCHSDLPTISTPAASGWWIRLLRPSAGQCIRRRCAPIRRRAALKFGFSSGRYPSRKAGRRFGRRPSDAARLPTWSGFYLWADLALSILRSASRRAALGRQGDGANSQRVSYGVKCCLFFLLLHNLSHRGLGARFDRKGFENRLNKSQKRPASLAASDDQGRRLPDQSFIFLVEEFDDRDRTKLVRRSFASIWKSSGAFLRSRGYFGEVVAKANGLKPSRPVECPHCIVG